MTRSAARITGLICVLNAAPSAQAHLVSTELGPFYDGAAHALVTPADLLAILAIAGLSSLAGVNAARRAAVTLIVAWCIGLAGGFVVPETYGRSLVVPTAVWTGLTLLAGVLAAAGFRASVTGVYALAGVIGMLGGLANGAAARADGVALTTPGIATGVGSIALVVAAASVWLNQRGWQIVVRVAASWIAAASLLMLGWIYRSAWASS